ncbi:MAG: phage major capsid protein [Gammaproteobacteria bacterium]|nr:phage major capsid protein [Gammaproteobacteria bacterium]
MRNRKLSPELRTLADSLDSQCAALLEADPDRVNPEQMKAAAGIMQRMNKRAELAKRNLTDDEQYIWDQLKNVGEGPAIRRYVTDADGNRVELGRDRQPGSDWQPADSGSGWRDSRGREVRTLTRSESFADAVRSSHDPQEWRGLGFGDFCRALVAGPRTDVERRALAEGSQSAGGFTVPTPLAAQVIDRLRARAVTVRAGATTIPMTSQTLSIAKLLTDPTASWHSENSGITDYDVTFGECKLTARTLVSLVKCSRELVEDSTNLNTALTGAFAQALALEVDRVALVGSGTPPEPQGLMTAVGVNEVSMGTAGATLTGFTKVIDLWQALDVANVPYVNAWIMHPRSFRQLFTQLATADGHWINPPSVLWAPVTGEPILNPDSSNSPLFLKTTSIPVTQTMDTSHDCSTIFAGDFRDMLIGVRSGLQIQVLDQTFAGNHQIGFLASMRVDIQLARPASFGRLIGLRG